MDRVYAGFAGPVSGEKTRRDPTFFCERREVRVALGLLGDDLVLCGPGMVQLSVPAPRPSMPYSPRP